MTGWPLASSLLAINLKVQAAGALCSLSLLQAAELESIALLASRLLSREGGLCCPTLINPLQPQGKADSWPIAFSWETDSSAHYPSVTWQTT